MCVYFWACYSDSLITVCFYANSILFNYYSFVIHFEIGSMILLALFFFLKVALAIWDLLCFHISLRIICSISVENTIGILIGIVLN